MVAAPVPHLWTAGEEWTAELLNETNSQLALLLDPPEVTVRISSAIGYVNGWSPYAWDTAIKNNYSLWSPAAPDLIIITVSGWYEIEMTSTWAAVATASGQRRQHALSINGAASTEYRGRADFRNGESAGAQAKTFRSVYDIFFSEGDSLQMMVFNGDAATRTSYVDLATGEYPTLNMRWYALTGA